MTQSAELEAGSPQGVLSCETRSNVLLHLLLKMKSQFLVKLVLNGAPPKQRSKTEDQIAKHSAPPIPSPGPGPRRLSVWPRRPSPLPVADARSLRARSTWRGGYSPR